MVGNPIGHLSAWLYIRVIRKRSLPVCTRLQDRLWLRTRRLIHPGDRNTPSVTP